MVHDIVINFSSSLSASVSCFSLRKLSLLPHPSILGESVTYFSLVIKTSYASKFYFFTFPYGAADPSP